VQIVEWVQGSSARRLAPVSALLLLTLSCAAPRTEAKAAGAIEARAPVAPDGSIGIALTFDDLPSHGPEPVGEDSAETHRRILAALRKHGVPPVVGFVNGAPLEKRPELRAVLQDWLAAGQRLGNHTWSHPSAAEVKPEAFLAEIERVEPLLRSLVPGDEAGWRWFRYPYLEQGGTLEARDAIRSWLQSHRYRIAEVTVDSYDWAWNEPYGRCRAAGNDAAIAELERSYLQQVDVDFAFFDSLAWRLWGRQIRHVFLLHVGAFDARMLDRSLSALERRGARWITLEEALADPVYAESGRVAPSRGNSVQEDAVEARHIGLVPWPNRPEKELAGLCAASSTGAPRSVQPLSGSAIP
jgi:peptidoglycan/xylan/chitin deacetylase (PgdA/CDA1 family)